MTDAEAPMLLTGAEMRALLEQNSQRHAPLFVLFVTPLCGTCKLALRMLDIVQAADPSLPIFRCNLNTAPDLAQRFQIASVPALASIVRGMQTDVLYRMQSVDVMLRWLQIHG